MGTKDNKKTGSEFEKGNESEEPKGKIDTESSESNDLLEDAYRRQIEANTRLTDENARLISESRKLIDFKRKLGLWASIVGFILHIIILIGLWRILFVISGEGDEAIKLLSISSGVLSFVVIYVAIIRGALASHRQKNDDHNTPASEILDFINRTNK